VTSMLSIRDLSVRYRRDGVAALKGVSLDVETGERLAIIGESGSGKSTLALAIAGLLAGSAKVEGRIDWTTPKSGSSHSFAPPTVLPDISPTREEIRCLAGFRQSPTLKRRRGAETANLPHWGRCPAGQRGARRTATLVAVLCPASPSYSTFLRRVGLEGAGAAGS